MLKIAGLLLVVSVFCSAKDTASDWSSALNLARLNQSDLRFDILDLVQVGSGESSGFRKGPAYLAMHDDPLRIPFYVKTYRESLLKNKSKAYEITVFGLQKIGYGFRRALAGDPTSEEWNKSNLPNSLADAVGSLFKAGRKSWSTNDKKSVENQVKGWPKSFQRIVSYLILAELKAYNHRNAALGKLIGDSQLKSTFQELTRFTKSKGEDETEPESPLVRKLRNELDFAELTVGGVDLSFAIDRVIAELKKETWPQNMKLNLKTPLGIIRISSEIKNDVYKEEPSFLIVDLGGDDTYLSGGGTASVENPVSVLLDVTGNDQYLAAQDLPTDKFFESPLRFAKLITPMFGAGILGYGFLCDLSGDDIYRAFRETEGRGNFGFGWLMDLAGNDKYLAWYAAQGSANFGLGQLIDLSGKDEYWGFQKVQGFGGHLGSGLLADFDKQNDNYLSDDKKIEFPSPIDPKHNTNLSQGFAMGRRADITDGKSLPGGFGGLLDEGGDNNFSCGFFCQGSTYWYGVGWLSVGPGQDKYSAAKYAMGAGVHFGVGVLHDTGGDDLYVLEQELGLGEGHDYGVGFLLEDSGDDRFDSQNLSLGAASGQGIGLFWDRRGNDKYKVKGPESLGAAALRVETPTVRTLSKTIGIFIDSQSPNVIVGDSIASKSNSAQSWRRPSEGKNTFGLGWISRESDIEDPK